MAAPSGPAVANLLAEETEVLRRFLTLLEREQTLLSEGSVDALAALAPEKSAFAERLAGLTRQREAQLASDHCPQMRDWLTRPGNNRLEAAWQQLLELARQAKQLNETNGQLIALRLQHNQQALAVLMAAANQAMTYGPDGQQRPSGGGRTLGSA